MIHLGFVVWSMPILYPFPPRFISSSLVNERVGGKVLLASVPFYRTFSHSLSLLYMYPLLLRRPEGFFTRERQSVLKCVNALEARAPAYTQTRGGELSKQTVAPCPVDGVT